MQVLLVEDNPGDIRLIRECFRDNPYPEKFEIIDFGTLSQTIQFLNSNEKKNVGAILLDLGLPDSMGLATLEKIQNHTNGIPIIILTGMDDSELALQAVKEGAQDYLLKNQVSGQLLTKSILYSAERKNVEELKSQKKIAEEANRKKSEFLAMMSHEIKNPLGVIIGFSDLLMTTDDESTYKNFANTIQSNANHLNELINDILDLSRIEAGRIDLEKTLFPLRLEMEATCEGLKKQAFQKSLEFDLFFEDALPDVVRTDRTRLRQVIYNLVGNAIKFTSEGGISVHVKSGSQQKSVEITVKDTGCGIDKKDTLNLFQPFSQANSSIYRQYRGTGLGLTLSKQIAKSLGGDLVLFDSTPGKGSTFLLVIDSGLSNLSSLEVESNNFPKNQRSDNSIADSLQGVKILVVDDDLTMRELEKDILVSVGATVKAVENGVQANSEIKSWCPDVVFMDIQMPELNGCEAVRKMRCDGHNGPVIALTANPSVEGKNRCLSSGYDDFLAKPFRINSLIQMASKWVEYKARIPNDAFSTGIGN